MDFEAFLSIGVIAVLIGAAVAFAFAEVFLTQNDTHPEE